MRLIRHAHACFSLEDAAGRTWLFDPYRPGGLGGRFRVALPELHPYRVLLTHAHEDHAWRAASFADVPVWEEACPAGDSWEAGARLRVAAVPLPMTRRSQAASERVARRNRHRLSHTTRSPGRHRRGGGGGR